MRYNLEQTVWRLFHVLAQFLFTTSEAEQDYSHQKVNVRIMSQELGFSKIRKFQENDWNVWIWYRVPNRPLNRPPKMQILAFVLESHKKSAVHSIKKPILPKFENLSAIPCSRLQSVKLTKLTKKTSKQKSTELKYSPWKTVKKIVVFRTPSTIYDVSFLRK